MTDNGEMTDNREGQTMEKYNNGNTKQWELMNDDRQLEMTGNGKW